MDTNLNAFKTIFNRGWTRMNTDINAFKMQGSISRSEAEAQRFKFSIPKQCKFRSRSEFKK